MIQDHRPLRQIDNVNVVVHEDVDSDEMLPADDDSERRREE